MGKLTAYRNFLFNLFPQCFAASLPVNKVFCVMIIDLTQKLAAVKHASEKYVDPQWRAQDARAYVQTRMNDNEYINGARVRSTTVVLLDSPGNVPKIKATRQKERDKANETQNESTSIGSNVIMDEEAYNRFAEEYDVEAMSHLIVNSDFLCPFSGDMIWRSVNLRLQFYRVVVQELLRMSLKKGKVLIVDDGPAIDERRYVEWRNTQIEANDYGSRSEYEKECLIGCVGLARLNHRFILYDDGHYARLPASSWGEADVKVCEYITRDGANDSFLLYSQDTDSIFILLLHMKNLINPESGRLDDTLEVWIDTQTPIEAGKPNRPYRFINIRQLYEEIVAFFAREFPCIASPIETLTFLAYARETDFTQPFHPFLKIGDVCVWDTFSQLHTCRTDGTYAAFNQKAPTNEEKAESGQKRKRATSDAVAPPRMARVKPHPQTMRFVLSGAISVVYNEELQCSEVRMDAQRVAHFFYYLCQSTRLRSDLNALGYVTKQLKGESVLLTPDDIFTYTSEIADKIRQLKQQSNESRKKAEVQFSVNGKQFKSSPIENASAVNSVERLKNHAREMVKQFSDKKEPIKVSLPFVKSATGSASNRSPVDVKEVGKLLHGLRDIGRVKVEKIEDIDEGSPWQVGGTGRFDTAAEIEDFDDDDTFNNSDRGAASIPVTRTNPKGQQHIDTHWTKLSSEDIPIDYGIPRKRQMLARIYRIHWVMNYSQNGWRTRHYAHSCCASPVTDETLSQWGWRAREIKPTDHDFKFSHYNNSYLQFQSCETVNKGEFPVRVFETEECDNIYNRDYEHFSL